MFSEKKELRNKCNDIEFKLYEFEKRLKNIEEILGVQKTYYSSLNCFLEEEGFFETSIKSSGSIYHFNQKYKMKSKKLEMLLSVLDLKVISPKTTELTLVRNENNNGKTIDRSTKKSTKQKNKSSTQKKKEEG